MSYIIAAFSNYSYERGNSFLNITQKSWVAIIRNSQLNPYYFVVCNKLQRYVHNINFFMTGRTCMRIFVFLSEFSESFKTLLNDAQYFCWFSFEYVQNFFPRLTLTFHALFFLTKMEIISHVFQQFHIILAIYLPFSNRIIIEHFVRQSFVNRIKTRYSLNEA